MEWRKERNCPIIKLTCGSVRCGVYIQCCIRKTRAQFSFFDCGKYKRVASAPFFSLLISILIGISFFFLCWSFALPCFCHILNIAIHFCIASVTALTIVLFDFISKQDKKKRFYHIQISKIMMKIQFSLQIPSTEPNFSFNSFVIIRTAQPCGIRHILKIIVC